jgi:L-ectoine synthase
MIVRTLSEIKGTARDVTGDGWRSSRLLLREDGVGYSLHDTTVAAGGHLDLEYRHHYESCYVIEGEAEITELATGRSWNLGPGTIYALDQHDHHTLDVRSDLRLICVFNPALRGTERHVDGGYESSDD